ncbi:methyltransferase [Bacteroidia bacterium]|nr:methyltransferase [Bacteroidia bacterium]
MNSRERILACVAHREPDRVPVDLGATPSSGISVVAYDNLLRHLGKQLPVYGFDVIQQVAQPDEEILEMFGVDALDLGRFFINDPAYWQEMELTPGHRALYPKWLKVERDTEGGFLAYGNTSGRIVGRMPQGATFFDQTIFPYLDGFPADYKNLASDMALSVWGGIGIAPWDANTGPEFWSLLRRKAIEARENSDKALVLGIGCNLFEWGCFLRRMDNFMMDMFISPGEVHRLLDALMEIHMANLAKTCEAVGDVVDIIKFGDDLGMNTGPFMGEETYREFFKPRHRMLCDYARSHSRMITMIHSCGSIENLMPDLIDAGIEIFNPVQINALNMSPAHLKKEFGSEATFWGGGIDTQGVLNRATPARIREHVLGNLEIFARGGGYVFNPVHNIMADVPPENVMAMFEAVAEFNA